VFGSFGALTPLYVVLLVIRLAILVVVVAAFIDAATRPAPAYAYAGKLTKNAWLAILGVGALLTLLGILSFVGLIAAIVYFVDVRPAVRSYGSGGPRQGPYGPW
jgi:uncharacterized membrane protein